MQQVVADVPNAVMRIVISIIHDLIGGEFITLKQGSSEELPVLNVVV